MAKRRILIIDDDEDDRSMFIDAVKEVEPGAECIDTTGGIEAFEWLQSARIMPDIIFLDLNMPRMNGREFLEKKKKDDALKNIPVVIYSTSRRKEDIEMAMHLGAVFFLTKPDLFRDICNVLRELLSRRWD